MKKQISLLVLLWSLVGLGTVGLGCGSASDTMEPMGCDSDTDCPSGYICGISQTCVPLLTFDEIPCPEDDPGC